MSSGLFQAAPKAALVPCVELPLAARGNLRGKPGGNPNADLEDASELLQVVCSKAKVSLYQDVKHHDLYRYCIHVVLLFA